MKYLNDNKLLHEKQSGFRAGHSTESALIILIDSWLKAMNEGKWALAWYGKLTWESAHAWILIILCYLIVWGITLIFMVRSSFYAIPLLIYDVMNDITIIP